MPGGAESACSLGVISGRGCGMVRRMFFIPQGAKR